MPNVGALDQAGENMGAKDNGNRQAADRIFVRKVMAVPLLEAEHERDLARRWRDHNDVKALHQLTSAYLRLVISMAGRFRNYGLPMGDLIQEGNIGLMQAAARFDPAREVRFSTYASWWIRAAIQDYVLRNWSIVRTGSTSAQKSLFFNLRRLRALTNDPAATKLSPESVADISVKLGVREVDVEFMEARLAASDRSLNATVGDGDEAVEWQELLVDDGPLPEDIAMAHFDRDARARWLTKAFRNLTSRETLIIRERKLNDEAITLEALGKRLGISKERVRQIEQQALGKLKTAIIDEVGSPEQLSLPGG